MATLLLFTFAFALCALCLCVIRASTWADGAHLRGSERAAYIAFVAAILTAYHTLIFAVVFGVLVAVGLEVPPAAAAIVMGVMTYCFAYRIEGPVLGALFAAAERFMEEADRRSAARRAHEAEMRDLAVRRREGEALAQAALAAQEQLGELTKRSGDAFREALRRREGGA